MNRWTAALLQDLTSARKKTFQKLSRKGSNAAPQGRDSSASGVMGGFNEGANPSMRLFRHFADRGYAMIEAYCAYMLGSTRSCAPLVR